MKKVFLSIDWDYFIDADYDLSDFVIEANPGEWIAMEQPSEKAWENCYKAFPTLSSLKVRQEFYSLSVLFSSMEYWLKKEAGEISAFVSQSHGDAYGYFMSNTQKGDEITLLHVDRHHDCYNGLRGLDCSNWLRNFQERTRCEVTWIAPRNALMGKMGHEMIRPYITKTYWTGEGCADDINTGQNIFGERLDSFAETLITYTREAKEVYVFLCRSDLWTPPHLDKYFLLLARQLKRCKVLENHTPPTRHYIREGVSR